MNLTLKPQQQNTDALPCDILVGGKKIGDLRPHRESDGARWHAAINLERVYLRGYLIQGFGPTQEAAIADAIENGKWTALEQLSLVEELAASVGHQFKESPIGEWTIGVRPVTASIRAEGQ
ncbi:MAG TPA: hypothetical protein VK797_23125 [Tepidisphaeraceae bacterium]|jgi:hypothetical protein|nr:hypothetical protein [Tepidisphaeraceae bacterium]